MTSDDSCSRIPPHISDSLIADDPYGRVVLDAMGFVLHANAATADLVAMDVEEIVGRHVLEFVADEDRDLATDGVVEIQEVTPIEAEGIATVIGLARPDGSIVHVEIGSQNYLAENGLEVVVLRLRPYDAQFHLQRYFHSMLGTDGTGADDLALVASVDDTVQHAASALCSRWDGTAFGRVVSRLLPSELCGGAADDTDPGAPWVAALQTGQTAWAPTESLAPPVREPAEALGFTACWAVPVPGPSDGGSSGAAIVVWRTVPGPPKLGHREGLRRAVNAAALGFERADYQQALLTAATLDALTGLPNRAQFFAALHDETDPPHAVLYVDLDGFKLVNDAHGHRTGDGLLRAVAQRLAGAVDGSDLLARLGGDEFAVLIRKPTAQDDLIAIAERLVGALAPPFDIEGRPITVGLSVGIADHPGATGEALLDAADHALYAAKRDGRGTWAISPGPSHPTMRPELG